MVCGVGDIHLTCIVDVDVKYVHCSVIYSKCLFIHIFGILFKSIAPVFELNQ